MVIPTIDPTTQRCGFTVAVGDDRWFATFRRSPKGGWNARGCQRVQARPEPAVYPLPEHYRWPTIERAAEAVRDALAVR